MSCNGCFHGCVETTSDQCVKYTGESIPPLGIENGDSLASVENSLTSYLLTVMDGTGIKPNIDPSYICNLVAQYLPCCDPLTLLDILTALVRAVCNLQTQMDNVVADVATLNADYTIGSCLSVSPSAGTHDVLQAVINEVCSLATDITVLIASLTTYVKIADLNTYISAYLTGIPSADKMYNRMIPYVAYEYYNSDLSGFSVDGVGSGIWDKVYLCNGAHGTPDKRGRIPIGVTDMGGVTVDPVVAPGGPNPTYTLLHAEGANAITLAVQEMPTHTHVAAVTINDPGHKHLFGGDDSLAGQGYLPATAITYDTDPGVGNAGENYYTKKTDSTNDPQPTGLTNSNVLVVNATKGESFPHNNIPPVLACYYIMYLP